MTVSKMETVVLSFPHCGADGDGGCVGEDVFVELDGGAGGTEFADAAGGELVCQGLQKDGGFCLCDGDETPG